MKMIKPIIKQLSLAPSYFLFLRSRYCSRHSVQTSLINTLPLLQETKFHIHAKQQIELRV
jgi:hypothetical protein